MSSDHARDHLLVEIAKWHGGIRGLGIVATAGFDPRAHFTAQLGTFLAVGLLDQEEAALWWQRFDEATPPAPLEPDPALRERAEAYLASLDEETRWASLHALVDVGVLTMADAARWFAGEDDGHGDDDYAEVGQADLRAVVLGPHEEVNGVRVVAVELYPYGVILRWTAREFTPIGLADDAGTAYEERDMIAEESDGGGLRGHSIFAPAVPPAASRLAVEVGGARLEVQL